MELWEVDNIWLFLLALPVIAFLYSSVGHGGASGYLALMALFGFAPEAMRPTSLILNLFVAGTAFYFYWRAGHFNKKLFWSFALGSIPMAFLGGTIEADVAIYKRILAILLIFAILRILNVFGKESNEVRVVKFWQGLLVGAPIGFFSGLIGIGGGIILTPLILLLHWGKMKEAAAVSAPFIWVNSASALIGMRSQGELVDHQYFLMVILAFLGGLAGAYFGSKKFNLKFLRYLLALVLVIASLKLVLA